MFKNCVLVLCSIVAALLVCELILGRLPHASTYERKIEVTVPEPKCYGNCYTSNPNGYFPITLTVPNSMETLYCIAYSCQQRKDGFFQDRSKEIFIVGDSFTFGEGAKEEDSLGYLLGLTFTQYNFRNWGETAADLNRVSQIAKTIYEDPAQAHRGHIIYFYNLNDMAMAPSIANKQKYITDFENLRWTNVPAPSPLDQWLSHSALYRLFKKVTLLNRETGLTIHNYLDMYFANENAVEFRRTIDTLKTMNSQARAHGVNFTMVIYPLLYKDMWGHYPFMPIHEQLMKICHDNQINCIDGYNAFKDAPSLQVFTVHPVDFHPNSLANRRMVDYLKSQLDLK